MRQCCAPGRCTWDPAHQYYSVPPRPLLPSPAPFALPPMEGALGIPVADIHGRDPWWRRPLIAATAVPPPYK